MVQTFGISPEELRVRDGEYVSSETPLETAWTFWYDKKTSDRKESDQYMEGLKQLGSFNTIEGFYRHYTFLLRPSEFPRDHNVLLFRRGYKPMWEEFPEGGCWIIRIKRKVSMSYVNRMWENLLLACIGEAFEMPDVVGCVLSTRLKDDVLSVWNLSNRDTPARFRIGEKLKEVLDLDMNALIQYKDHMQSLQDYSTYRNAKNYMFAPSPSITPQDGTPPVQTYQPGDDFDAQGLPPLDLETDLLPPAAVDLGGYDSFGRDDLSVREASYAEATEGTALQGSQAQSAATIARSPKVGALQSPQLSADATPWNPPGDAASVTVAAVATSRGQSPALCPSAAAWYPPASGGGGASATETKAVAAKSAAAAAPEACGQGLSAALCATAAPWYPPNAGGGAANAPEAALEARTAAAAANEAPEQAPAKAQGQPPALCASAAPWYPTKAGGGGTGAAEPHGAAAEPKPAGAPRPEEASEGQEQWGPAEEEATGRGQPAEGPPAGALGRRSAGGPAVAEGVRESPKSYAAVAAAAAAATAAGGAAGSPSKPAPKARQPLS